MCIHVHVHVLICIFILYQTTSLKKLSIKIVDGTVDDRMTKCLCKKALVSCASKSYTVSLIQ